MLQGIASVELRVSPTRFSALPLPCPRVSQDKFLHNCLYFFSYPSTKFVFRVDGVHEDVNFHGSHIYRVSDALSAAKN